MSNDNITTADPLAPTVTFDYIKGNTFHCVHADGALGGLTPNGHIHMAFYSERSAIPRRTVHELHSDGRVGDAREIETRNSIVRELAVDVFLSIDAARALVKWLDDQISGYDTLTKENKNE